MALYAKKYAKKRFILCATGVLLCVAMVVQAETVVRLSEPVATTPLTETFGVPIDSAIDPSVPPVSLSQLLEQGERALGETVKLEATVGKVCQKKGCFFVAQDGEHTIRVAFKDYGFFIPTNSALKRVTLVGELTAVVLTPQQSAHLVQDAPGAEIVAGPQFEFLASAVRIPKG